MKNIKTVMIQIYFFVSLIISYKYVIYDVFNYMGYFENDFEIQKLLESATVLLSTQAISFLIKDEFSSITIRVFMFFCNIPLSVFYVFNDCNFGLLIIFSIPIFIISITSNFLLVNKEFKNKKMMIFKGKSLFLTLILLFILIIPFVLKLGNANINNLWLDEIYDTRGSYESKSLLMGYLANPLAKIMFPILILIGFEIKNKILIIFSIFSICVIFLTTGAQKDMLIGILLIVFCYLINKKKKDIPNNLTFFISNITLLSVFLYKAFGFIFISNYIRRLFFIGPSINSMYYDYFNIHNFTFYSHTKIGNLFFDEDRIQLTKWAGNEIVGNGTNANIGIFMEGYVSFGFLGLIYISFLFSMIVLFLSKLNMSKKYIGIWISIIYMINFSLFDILLITHGMLLFIILCYFIVPKEENIKKEQEHLNESLNLNFSRINE